VTIPTLAGFACFLGARSPNLAAVTMHPVEFQVCVRTKPPSTFVDHSFSGIVEYLFHAVPRLNWIFWFGVGDRAARKTASPVGVDGPSQILTRAQDSILWQKMDHLGGMF